MSAALYNRDILRLAASLFPDDKIASPSGTAEARSPLCGSRIKADVCVNSAGNIERLALRANACALGQASAAILRGHATGLSKHNVLELRDGVANCLDGNGDMPTIWPDLALLAVACCRVARGSGAESR